MVPIGSAWFSDCCWKSLRSPGLSSCWLAPVLAPAALPVAGTVPGGALPPRLAPVSDCADICPDCCMPPAPLMRIDSDRLLPAPIAPTVPIALPPVPEACSSMSVGP